MRGEFRLGEWKYKLTGQSGEGFFLLSLTLSIFWASCFLTWRVTRLNYLPNWRVTMHTPGWWFVSIYRDRSTASTCRLWRAWRHRRMKTDASVLPSSRFCRLELVELLHTCIRTLDVLFHSSLLIERFFVAFYGVLVMRISFLLKREEILKFLF
jgi:hypothetical protein